MKYSTVHGPRRNGIYIPYYMGVHAVTQAQYTLVMDFNPSYRTFRMERSKRNMDYDASRFPVERVSWFDAMEFCRRLSDMPEEREAGRVYRLATEAEWEFACRAGTATPFHFGGITNGHQSNVGGSRPYGTDERGPAMNRPEIVGSYPANAFGLYDMHGNVWEAAERRCEDESCRTCGSWRGGSWDSAAEGLLRCTFRSTGMPNYRFNNYGFRLVLAKEDA